MAWLGQATCLQKTSSLEVEIELLPTWRKMFPSDGQAALAYQAYEPATGAFLFEGEWEPVNEPGRRTLVIPAPAEEGPYQFWISLVHPADGWAYERGQKFLLVDAEVAGSEFRLLRQRITTLRGLRLRLLPRTLLGAIAAPFATIGRNWSLIQAMVERDIHARYKGSFGDIFWTVLQPVLLMMTYIFVFSVVLNSKIEGDPGPAGYALFFLCGMMPWLAFSESMSRAPFIVWEHRNFVKKLLFPVEILPVNITISGLVTAAMAFIVYLFFMMAAKGHLQWSMTWLPVVIIPQILFTMGMCWLMAVAGVFIRDLTQINGFILTLWFFLTPICYSDKSLPQQAMPLFRRNPMYAFVRAYRLILLEGRAPEFEPMLKMTLFSIFLFFFGHWLFKRMKRQFPDIV